MVKKQSIYSTMIMKQILTLITVILMTISSLNGQKKVYYDIEGNITNKIGNAVEYRVTESGLTGKDSLIKHTNYYMTGQKKSELSYLLICNKRTFNEQKFIGEEWKWFENGKTQMQAFYKDGQLQGEFRTFWSNGKQRRYDIYENGKLIEGNCFDSLGNKIPKYFPYMTVPKFPGGDKNLFKYLGEQVKYPEEAQEKKIQGRVITQFYVEKDGKISDIRILNNLNYYLSMEAFRVIQAMPDWTPGTLEGEKVRVKFTLPINFMIQDSIK